MDNVQGTFALVLNVIASGKSARDTAPLRYATIGKESGWNCRKSNEFPYRKKEKKVAGACRFPPTGSSLACD